MLKAIQVGRSKSCDVVLNDPSISRVHAEIIAESQGKFYVTDCASSGGTYVVRDGDWQKVRQSYIDGGETILLGQYQTSVQQLIDLYEGKGTVGSGPKKGTSTGGRQALPQDALPEGPVRRDPLTGELISTANDKDK